MYKSAQRCSLNLFISVFVILLILNHLNGILISVLIQFISPFAAEMTLDRAFGSSLSGDDEPSVQGCGVGCGFGVQIKISKLHEMGFLGLEITRGHTGTPRDTWVHPGTLRYTQENPDPSKGSSRYTWVHPGRDTRVHPGTPRNTLGHPRTPENTRGYPGTPKGFKIVNPDLSKLQYGNVRKLHSLLVIRIFTSRFSTSRFFNVLMKKKFLKRTFCFPKKQTRVE